MKGVIFGGALLLLGFGFGGSVLAQALLGDPTRPPVSVVRGDGPAVWNSKKWKLTSVLIGPQRRIAVINGRPVRVGQVVDGAELTAVEPGKALLHYAGRTIQLKLTDGTVKQAVKPAF